MEKKVEKEWVDMDQDEKLDVLRAGIGKALHEIKVMKKELDESFRLNQLNSKTTKSGIELL